MSSKVGGILERIYPNSRLTNVKRFSKGVINQTYRFKVDGKELVLRIYPKDFWKAEKEKYLYGLIKKKTDVLVPDVIASGKNFILMTMISGKELSLGNKNMIRKAGEALAKIHSIKFPYYGWIIGKQIKPKFRKWSDFLDYDISLKFKRIPNKTIKKKITAIIDDNRHLLDIKSKPCLLHKDYHPSHIIVKDEKINGVVDIEWAIAGHNELDIAKSCSWMFAKKPELEGIFLDGYRKYGQLSKEFDSRKKFYKLINLVSALSFSYECKHKKWCIYNLKGAEGVVNEYNKNH